MIIETDDYGPVDIGDLSGEDLAMAYAEEKGRYDYLDEIVDTRTRAMEASGLCFTEDGDVRIVDGEKAKTWFADAWVIWRSREWPATMDDFVSEYCAIAEEGAAFDDVRLASLREKMTETDIVKVEAWLIAELKETDALEAYARVKRLTNLSRGAHAKRAGAMNQGGTTT